MTRHSFVYYKFHRQNARLRCWLTYILKGTSKVDIYFFGISKKRAARINLSAQRGGMCNRRAAVLLSQIA